MNWEERWYAEAFPTPTTEIRCGIAREGERYLFEVVIRVEGKIRRTASGSRRSLAEAKQAAEETVLEKMEGL